jgi:hypothetical protein
MTAGATAGAGGAAAATTAEAATTSTEAATTSAEAATTSAEASVRLLLDVGNSVGTLDGIRDAVFLGPEIQAALADVAHADERHKTQLRHLGLWTPKKRSRPAVDD